MSKATLRAFKIVLWRCTHGWKLPKICLADTPVPETATRAASAAVLAVAGSACYRGAASADRRGRSAHRRRHRHTGKRRAGARRRCRHACRNAVSAPVSRGQKGASPPRASRRILRQKATVLLHRAPDWAALAAERGPRRRDADAGEEAAAPDFAGSCGAGCRWPQRRRQPHEQRVRNCPRPAKELILTPHPGEMSRLTGLSVEAVAG